MEEMKDRIRQIMESQHMSQQTFANFIGMSAASLSSIFNNRTKPTLNTVEAIKSKMPRLSTDWLMFGRGSMFIDDTPTTDPSPVDDTDMGSEHVTDFGGGVPDLFGGNQTGASVQQPVHRHVESVIRPEVKYVERPQRQITEIRVYFDDLTYETFVPKK
uniref:helix-turn-helix domain-containing protein n=1 Tax=Prevotella sp. TaxID=59823 RepID=UPI00338FE954